MPLLYVVLVRSPLDAVGVGSSCTTAEGNAKSPLLSRWFGPPFSPSDARGVGSSFIGPSEFGIGTASAAGTGAESTGVVEGLGASAGGAARFVSCPLYATSVSVQPKCTLGLSVVRSAVAFRVPRESATVGVGSRVGASEFKDGRTAAPGLGDWLLP
ncbi:hypothetical protein [Streptomyces sp. NPDC091215]|uniref:hypothetical protein n=1 Tax=Streptomyces sp. NPDC091215 TaxID=3155192 RepID=UPI00343C24F9